MKNFVWIEDGPDLTAEQFVLDPYSVYDHLRATAPVWFSPQLTMWVATDYASVERILMDAQNFGKVEAGALPPTPDEIESSASLLDLDPPDHTRLRSLVAPAFAPIALETWSGVIDELVGELLGEVAAYDRIDVVSQFSLPLAIRVISRIIGVPRTDEGALLRATHEYVRGLDVTQSAEVRNRGAMAHAKLTGYFRGAIEGLRADPSLARGSLMRELMEASHRGQSLSSEELVSLCVLLLFGGYETTFSMIASGIRLILERPALAQAVREDVVNVRRLTAEILRFESPVQRLGYYVQEDCQLGGAELKRGDQILACVGSANRDPQIFPAPDVFDERRSPAKQHMALGKGIHYCVGGPLALLEGHIAIPAFIKAFPEASLLDSEPVWAPTSSHRRPLRMMVALR